MIKKYNLMYMIGIPAICVALFFLGFVTTAIFSLVGIIGGVTTVFIFNIGFSSGKKKLDKTLAERGFTSNHTFNATREYVLVDLNRKEIAVLFKYNPSQPVIAPLADVTDAKVNDFKRGSGIMEGTQGVAFEFKLKGQMIRVYTFFSNQRYKMNSNEVLTGISKAEMMVQTLQLGSE